jgi:hypothetical protein
MTKEQIKNKMTDETLVNEAALKIREILDALAEAISPDYDGDAEADALEIVSE